MHTYKLITVAGVFGVMGLVAAPALWADATYQETVQITGGSLVDALRSMPFGQTRIRKMLAPVNSVTLLHGNQLAIVSTSSAQVIDLDHETITQIDNGQKTYSVTTFAQMRQAFQGASDKLAQAQAQAAQPQSPNASSPPPPPLQVTFDVSVSDPGASKLINGLMAQEQLVILRAHVTDPNSPPANGPNSVTYTFLQDIWTTPEPAELQQVDDFYQRYAMQLMQGVDVGALMSALRPAVANTSVGTIFASDPQLGGALQQMTQRMATELQKIHGVRVLEITRLGGETMPTTPGSGSVPPAPPTPNPSTAIAGQVASDTATEVATSQVGRLGMFGSALGHSMLGAFHHPAPPPAQSAPGSDPASATLYETTTQKSGFSQDPIPADAFNIPAGYRQIDSAYTGATPH